MVLHEFDLAARIRELQEDRKRHEDAIAAIDRVLHLIQEAMVAAPDSVPPQPIEATGGFPVKPAPAPLQLEVPARRSRGRFDKTAEESVLQFIRDRGAPSTADINRYWRSLGRKGTANVTLFKLLRANLIRREQDPAVRGSRYLAIGGEEAEPKQSAPDNHQGG